MQWVISGHALMISAGFLLKKLGHEHNIAVLVSSDFLIIVSKAYYLKGFFWGDLQIICKKHICGTL